MKVSHKRKENMKRSFGKLSMTRACEKHAINHQQSRMNNVQNRRVPDTTRPGRMKCGRAILFHNQLFHQLKIKLFVFEVSTGELDFHFIAQTEGLTFLFTFDAVFAWFVDEIVIAEVSDTDEAFS